MTPFDINVRHLAALSAIVETGSLSAAARRIHLSQPAVTQGIRKLEQQFDAQFFVRRPEGMLPTEAGEILAVRGHKALGLIGSSHATATQIKAFLAVARAGSYVAAALDTGLSEPSLHRAVADLGAASKARLVERRDRSLALTRRGSDAVRRFSLAMDELESAIVEIAALRGQETGRIVIGAMPLSRSRLLPQAIASFRAAHRDVKISVIEGSHAELVGPLRQGQIAMMLGALRNDPGPDLRTTALFADTPYIMGRAGHPLASEATLSAKNLSRYPWIMPAERTPLRALWVQMYDLLGQAPPPVMIECGSAITIRQLLLSGDYLALLSLDQMAVELSSGLLQAIGPAPGGLSRSIGVTTRIDWRPTQFQSAFLRCLEDVTRKPPTEVA